VSPAIKNVAYATGNTNNPVPNYTPCLVLPEITYKISGTSGSGGGAATAAGILNTSGVSGTGGSPQPLDPTSFKPLDARVNPGTFDGAAVAPTGTDLNPVKVTVNFSLSIGPAKNGGAGSDGGNNRNDSKGGGAAAGKEGSAAVYKIF
jgi:hypothetical protein